MNASDFNGGTTEQAPVEVPGVVAAASTGADDLPPASESFALAFGSEQEEQETAVEEESTQGEEVEESAAAEASQTAPPELTQEYIDAQVQRRVEEVQRSQAEAAQRRQVEAALGQMSDAEYGQYMRQYSQQIAQYRSAQEQAMVSFYKESTTDVLTNVAELKSLTPDEAKRINPQNANSYSQLVSNMIDVAADKRAAKIAEPKAKEMFEAWKATEQAKLAKKARTVAEMSGAATVPGGVPDFDKTSGREQLAAAFSKS